MTVALRELAERPHTPPAERTPYRHDIDGLRAVAVMLVVVYHIWLGRVSGGVDVFLMISAFFLTDSFVRRVDSGRPLRLGRFWLGRFLRLVPAAAVVILAALVGAALVVPASRLPEIWSQSWASLFYMQNWELAFNSVDYYARDNVIPSPLQHFWSLSIQGQVFILWPLLFALSAIISRRTRASPRAVLTMMFGALFVVSLVFSAYETATNQQFAYFDTRTRLWEFALGSLLALLLPLLRVGVVPSALLGWLGIAGLVSCGLVLDVAGGFPGYLALWPTLSAAAVIVGGASGGRGGPARLLASRPLSALGRNAYALYLVHWPILILWLMMADSSHVRIREGFIILAVSLVAAFLLRAGVEDPIRRLQWPTASPARSAVSLGLIVLLVAVPLSAWQTWDNVRSETAQRSATKNSPGAALLLPGADLSDFEESDTVVPAPSQLDQEWVALDGPCDGASAPTAPILREGCAQLTPKYSANRLVLVVGDSHTQQLMGSLLPVAESHNWDVMALLKGGCSLVADELLPTADPSCAEWRDEVVEYALALRPDAVFTVATAAEREGSAERRSPGLEGQIERLTGAQIDVIAVRDNPRFESNMYECVERAKTPYDDCSRERNRVLADDNPARLFAETNDRVFTVDFTDYLCPEGSCRAVIGNVAVYMDDNHLTGSYARSLSPVLLSQLQDQGW